MPINQDTHYVIKNGIVEQPAVVKDGLELYYDAKGKHNSDTHKDTLLDLSGNNRHGTLVNFAYEGVSGYQENGTGGILLDDVDDKIVRPAIPNIEYTSASRNLLNLIPVSFSAAGINISNTSTTVTLTGTSTGTLSALHSTFTANWKIKLAQGTYTISPTSTTMTSYGVMIGVFDGVSLINQSAINSSASFTCEDGEYTVGVYVPSGVALGSYVFNLQIEKGSTSTGYTPYIPLPIMTYQMNGNILSFEKDGTVKRTIKDANGNEVVVARKGINLVRNGNFANSSKYWLKRWSNPRTEEGEIIFTPTAQWGGVESTQDIGNTQGDIFYASIDMKTSSPGCCFFMINGIANKSSNMHSGSGEYERLHVRYEYNISGGTKNFLVPQSSHSTTFGEIRVKNAQGINLTQAYGAGNEPTLDYIKAHPEEFAWTPNPNDLIETVEIKNNLVGDLENLQGNDFEQHEDGVITYTNEAEKGSVVRVDIDGISDQPLRFRTAIGEQVVITEHDQVDADAIKKIEFQGNSVQLSDKYREVSGTSVVIAPDLHDKNVADKLVIGGNTYQYTESSNVVTDGLEMWLSGRNFSNSPATTTWKDLTGVNNGTTSGFAYTSASGSDGSGGVVFDGVDDVIVLNSLNTLKNGQITCEIKLNVKNQKASGWQSFFGGTLGNSFSIGILPTSFKLGATLTNLVDAQASSYTFPLNTDVHVAVTYSTFTKILKYYINGVLITTVNNVFSGAIPTGSTNKIGAHSSAGTGALDGNVKFARIYNRALTDAEILQNYNAGLSIPIPNIAMPQEIVQIGTLNGTTGKYETEIYTGNETENLVVGSSTEYVTKTLSNWNSSLTARIPLSDFRLKIGDTVTLSYYLNCIGVGGAAARINFVRSDNNNYIASFSTNYINAGAEGYVKHTAVIPNDCVKIELMAQRQYAAADLPSTQIQIKELKLEKGSNPNPVWSPALADIPYGVITNGCFRTKIELPTTLKSIG